MQDTLTPPRSLYSRREEPAERMQGVLDDLTAHLQLASEEMIRQALTEGRSAVHLVSSEDLGHTHLRCTVVRMDDL